MTVGAITWYLMERADRKTSARVQQRCRIVGIGARDEEANIAGIAIDGQEQLVSGATIPLSLVNDALASGYMPLPILAPGATVTVSWDGDPPHKGATLIVRLV